MGGIVSMGPMAPMPPGWKPSPDPKDILGDIEAVWDIRMLQEPGRNKDRLDEWTMKIVAGGYWREAT